MTTTKPTVRKGGRLFSPGAVYATPGALSTWTRIGLIESLARHVAGDWGDLCEEDKLRNNEALVDGSRILSAYQTELGEKLWIITEAEGDDGIRESTTLLLPEEY